MWFYLGLITFVISANIYLKQQLKFKSVLENRTKPKRSAFFESQSYLFEQQDFQDADVCRLCIETDCETSLQFFVKRENTLDKIAKMLGISQEFDTGNAQFDHQFYLTSITQEDAQTLGKNTQIMQLIKVALFNSISGYENFKKSNKNKIICDGKKLYIEIYSKKTSKIEPSSQRFNNILMNIQLLKNTLQNHKPLGQHFWKIPAQRNSAIFLALSLAFATWGGFEIIRFFASSNLLFSPFSLVSYTLILSAFALLVTMLLILRLVKKSARRHLILLNVILIGGFGLIFTIYGLLYDLNIMADTSNPNIVSYELTNKYTERHRTRRSSYTTYHLSLSGTQAPVKPTIKVSSAFYTQVNKGDFIAITIRNGYLNQPWMENIQKCIDCDATGDNKFW
jgi:hypothetical protein